MIRRCLLALAMLVLSMPARAEVLYATFTSSGTSQTITLSRSASTLSLANDDTSNSVFIRVFTDIESAAASTASYIEVKHGETLTLTHNTRTEGGHGYAYLTYICSAGTPAGRVVYK